MNRLASAARHKLPFSIELLPFRVFVDGRYAEICTGLNALRSRPTFPRKANSAHRPTAKMPGCLNISLIFRVAAQRQARGCDQSTSNGLAVGGTCNAAKDAAQLS